MTFNIQNHIHRAAGLISLSLAVLYVAPVDAKKIDGDTLFDPGRLVEIRVEIPPKDWDQLRRQSPNPASVFSGLPHENPYSYFEADIWIDGTKISSVGIRKKGFLGSSDAQRPSLKVKFDEYKQKQDPISGLSRLTLNNNKQDRSQASQFLTYQLFRKAGNPAPRSSWAHVVVNGKSLGVYSHVESIKKPFLKRAFGDKSGNLYEGALTDFHPKALSSIEVKTNEDTNDLSDIRKLAEVLASSDELDLEELDRIVDLNAFFRHWALESLIGFWDGYSANQNNYYLYFNPQNAGRGQFIPWGADWAFTNGGPFARPGFGSSGNATVVYAQGILCHRLYHSKGGSARYQASLRRLMREVWDEDEMIANLDRIEDLVKPHLHTSQAGTEQALNELREFIRGRRRTVDRALENWRPDIPSEPRKPSYIVQVGTANGAFSTGFGIPRGETSAASDADITIQIHDEPVALKKVTASADHFRFPSFGGPGGFPGGGRPQGFPRGGPARPGNARRPPAAPAAINVVITAERSEGPPITMSFMIEQTQFKPTSDKTIHVTGNYQEGPTGGFGPPGFGGRPGRSVVGELRLNQAGTEPGTRVTGMLKLQIVESHGGLFSQRQPGNSGFGPPTGRGGNGPQRPATPPQAARPSPMMLPVQQVLDVDRNGTISAEEIDRATTSLNRLDRNGDGRLSRDELRTPAPDIGNPDRRNGRQRPENDEPDAASLSQPVREEDDSRETRPAPVVMTTQQDHSNMRDQLGISELRPGPSGNPDAPNSANYDESKANPFPELPRLLTLKSGRTIESAEDWWNQRRPEIVEDFEREVLGRVPGNVPDVKWELLKTVEKKLGQTDVVEKRLAGRVNNSDRPEISVNIMMSVVTPKGAKKPVPTLMQFGFTMFGPDGEELNFGGRRFGRSRGPSKEQLLVEAGWGCVTVNAYSVQEDSGGESANRFGPPGPSGGGLTRGIIGLTNKGQPRKPDQWGALRAWAWGASRGLDYLETDPVVDATRVGIDGVSRFGKAALVAMAFDQRFAAALVGSSGEGGASLYRRNFGESVESLASSGEYHWMAGNFLKYAARESSFGAMNASHLPVDAHMLIALCAPRPTFISYGVPEKGDALWLDQQGSFMATIAAQPAFRLLGARDLGRSDDYMKEKMPPVNTDLLDGELAWRQHDGGHTDMPNIPHFIKWVERLWAEH